MCERKTQMAIVGISMIFLIIGVVFIFVQNEKLNEIGRYMAVTFVLIPTLLFIGMLGYSCYESCCKVKRVEPRTFNV